MNPKLHLLTFSSQGYANPKRFLDQAKQSDFFDSITLFSDEDVEPLMKNHKLHFWVWRKRGFGFWIWKPFVIQKRLNQIPDGDFLVYADQGFHIQSRGKGLLDKYIETLVASGSWIGVFSAGENYRPESFVKRGSVMSYNPEFYQSGFGEYVYGGLLIIRNSDMARRAIADWRMLCESFPILDPIPIRLFQHPAFIGQDGDNGYLPVVLSKYGGYVKFDANDVNVFNSEGFQLHHVLPESDHESINWDSLSDKPFTVRRER